MQYVSGRYKEMEVNGSTPVQLVVLLYDHMLKHLTRAAMHPSPEQIDVRSQALQVCRTVLTELLVTLDRQRGGNVAVHLSALYSFLLGELTMLGLKPDAERLERITHIVLELREAFSDIAISPAPATRSVA